MANLAGNRNVFDQGSERAARASLFSVLATDGKEEEMVKQRFLLLWRRWLFTVAKVLGPILLFEGFVLVRKYLKYAPLGVLDLLMGIFVTLLATALLCLAWAWGEWCWSKLRRVRGFVSELRQCSRSYWRPEPAKTNKA